MEWFSSIGILSRILFLTGLLQPPLELAALGNAGGCDYHYNAGSANHLLEKTICIFSSLFSTYFMFSCQ